MRLFRKNNKPYRSWTLPPPIWNSLGCFARDIAPKNHYAKFRWIDSSVCPLPRSHTHTQTKVFSVYSQIIRGFSLMKRIRSLIRWYWWRPRHSNQLTHLLVLRDGCVTCNLLLNQIPSLWLSRGRNGMTLTCTTTAAPPLHAPVWLSACILRVCLLRRWWLCCCVWVAAEASYTVTAPSSRNRIRHRRQHKVNQSAAAKYGVDCYFTSLHSK